MNLRQQDVNKAIKRIPAPVIHRLTKYLVFVQELNEAGIEWVLSQEMANALGLTSSTVRQDLSHVECAGISKRGYETEKLKKALHKILGADGHTSVAIVGAGNLGRALALHGEFERRGFRISAVLDSNACVVGKRIGDLRIESMDRLREVVRTKGIDIGIIAVPSSSAQEVADNLVAAGITGLLNLTSGHIRARKGIAVADARIVASLHELLYLMRTAAEAGKRPP
jgi:redox-sensing transcriptional repressor